MITCTYLSIGYGYWDRPVNESFRTTVIPAPLGSCKRSGKDHRKARGQNTLLCAKGKQPITWNLEPDLGRCLPIL